MPLTVSAQIHSLNAFRAQILSLNGLQPNQIKKFPHHLGNSASQRRGDGATLGATSDHHRRRDLRSPFPLAIPRSARPHPADTVIHAGRPMIQPTRAPARRTVPRPQARIPKATTRAFPEISGLRNLPASSLGCIGLLADLLAGTPRLCTP
jgi:hypothetical protein